MTGKGETATGSVCVQKSGNGKKLARGVSSPGAAPLPEGGRKRGTAITEGMQGHTTFFEQP